MVVQFFHIPPDPQYFCAAFQVRGKIGGSIVITSDDAIIFFRNQLIKPQWIPQKAVIVIQCRLLIEPLRCIVNDGIQDANVAVKDGII